MARKPYQTIGLGGTFDHFHQGHAKFLDFAANLATTLKIGLTNSKLSQHKAFAHTIQPYRERYRSLKNYCHKKKILAEIVELSDPYGPTLDQSLEKKPIQALAVTEATVDGAKAINDLRQQMNLRRLPVHVCSLLTCNDGQPLSSTRVRKGETDRQGLTYSSLFTELLQLNQQQKAELSNVQGALVETISPDIYTYAVGDNTLNQFLAGKHHFNLGVYDLKEQRTAHDYGELKTIRPTSMVGNPAGQITPALVKEIEANLLKKGKLINVEGEEDLAVVPLVLLSPLSSKIYYGQPNYGLVEILVTEAVKAHFLGIVRM